MKYETLIKIIKESSTSGATSSANIATSVNGTGSVLRRNNIENCIGVGFDSDGDWGIYEKPSKKSNKSKK